MSNRQFAVIGHPLGHTMSPFIHSRLFQLAGREGEYSAIEISPENLAAAMPELRGLAGFNVTIPHKQAILPLLDGLNAKAKFFHSVNVVKNDGGKLLGYNTDSLGFARALQAAGMPLAGRVAVLGAGGAARALAFEAALGGASIVVAAREHSMPAAQLLAEEIRRKVPGAQAEACPLCGLHGEFDLLANATPVGMYPRTEESPVGEKVLSRCHAVFDAVYNPNDTLLLHLARECGAVTVHGMDMLVWQAAAAQEIWDGSVFSNSGVTRLCADAVTEMERRFHA